jgi:hypothetical protein
MDMSSTREPFSTTCTFRIHNKPVNKMWEWTAVPSVPVTAKAMLPSTSAVTIELAHGVKMITFVNTVSGDLDITHASVFMSEHIPQMSADTSFRHIGLFADQQHPTTAKCFSTAGHEYTS